MKTETYSTDGCEMTEKILDMVYDFSLSMCEKTLVDIFGEQLGRHLSDKYYGDRKNWLRWYGSLDSRNSKKLITYILKHS